MASETINMAICAIGVCHYERSTEWTSYDTRENESRELWTPEVPPSSAPEEPQRLIKQD